MMPQQQYHESSILRDYALVIIFVHLLSAFWIIFNEVVMGLGNVALDIVSSGPGVGILNFLILIWRIIPIGMVIGIWVYVFLRAVRREPYQQWVG